MDVNLYLLLALLATLLVIAYLLTRLPCPGPAFPYQRCPDGHKERQPQPPCTCTGKRHDKANLL